MKHIEMLIVPKNDHEECIFCFKFLLKNNSVLPVSRHSSTISPMALT